MALINKIKLSEIENFKDLSPEFYKAEYMKKSADIRKNKFRRLSQISYITDGEHGSPCWSDSSGIKYVTAEFIKENFIEQGITKQITFEQDRRNARARLKEGDILIYSVGAYAGLTCVAEPHLFPANIPRSVAIVRLNNNDEFYPEFISVFLNSNIGQFQSVRFRAGNSQPVLALEKIRQFEVPIFDNKIQGDIKALYQEAYKLRQQAQSLYKQAIDLLEQELGLDKISFQKLKSYRTTNSNVIISKRADAEFYNPELKNYYDCFQNVIGKELSPITQYARVIKYGNPDYAETGIPIITQKHLSDITPEGYTGFPIASIGWVAKYPSAVLRENDLLFYSVGAYLGKTNIWFNKDKAVHASFITMLRCENYYDAGYLMVLLNSKYGILQSKVFQSGSSQPYIYPKDIRQFLIPNIRIDLRIKLYDLMKESYEAKKQSQQFLADAKARVEQLIEEAANNA